MPTQIGNMKALTQLFLQNNKLSGSIPTELGKLTGAKLSKMDEFVKAIKFECYKEGSSSQKQWAVILEHLFFTNPSEWKAILKEMTSNPSDWQRGEILKEVWNLNAQNRSKRHDKFQAFVDKNRSYGTLQELVLDKNNFDSTLPSSICNLRNLKSLSVYQNKLSGAVPQPCVFPELTVLNLARNSFHGKLPSMRGWSNISRLLLHENKFSGGLDSLISDAASPLTNYSAYLDGDLSVITLHNNQLTKHIPEELVLPRRLDTFTISNNKIPGRVPKNLFQQIESSQNEKTTILLSNNRLSCYLPKQKNLRLSKSSLVLVGNLFSQQIPTWVRKTERNSTFLSTVIRPRLVGDTLRLPNWMIVLFGFVAVLGVTVFALFKIERLATQMDADRTKARAVRLFLEKCSLHTSLFSAASLVCLLPVYIHGSTFFECGDALVKYTTIAYLAGPVWIRAAAAAFILVYTFALALLLDFFVPPHSITSDIDSDDVQQTKTDDFPVESIANGLHAPLLSDAASSGDEERQEPSVEREPSVEQKEENIDGETGMASSGGGGSTSEFSKVPITDLDAPLPSESEAEEEDQEQQMLAASDEEGNGSPSDMDCFVYEWGLNHIDGGPSHGSDGEDDELQVEEEVSSTDETEAGSSLTDEDDLRGSLRQSGRSSGVGRHRSSLGYEIRHAPCLVQLQCLFSMITWTISVFMLGGAPTILWVMTYSLPLDNTISSGVLNNFLDVLNKCLAFYLAVFSAFLLPGLTTYTVRRLLALLDREGTHETNKLKAVLTVVSRTVLIIIVPCVAVIYFNDGCFANWRSYWKRCHEGEFEDTETDEIFLSFVEYIAWQGEQCVPITSKIPLNPVKHLNKAICKKMTYEIERGVCSRNLLSIIAPLYLEKMTYVVLLSALKPQVFGYLSRLRRRFGWLPQIEDGLPNPQTHFQNLETALVFGGLVPLLLPLLALQLYVDNRTFNYMLLNREPSRLTQRPRAASISYNQMYAMPVQWRAMQCHSVLVMTLHTLLTAFFWFDIQLAYDISGSKDESMRRLVPMTHGGLGVILLVFLVSAALRTPMKDIMRCRGIRPAARGRCRCSLCADIYHSRRCASCFNE